MKSKLLDKDKVIKALHTVQGQMYISEVYMGNDDPVSQSIKHMIHKETRLMILETFATFTMNLTIELDKCEPEKFPCALCHEEDTGPEDDTYIGYTPDGKAMKMAPFYKRGEI